MPSGTAPEEESPEPATLPSGPTLLPVEEFPRPERRATLEPVSATTFSLRADMSLEFKADLQRLQDLRGRVHQGKLGPLLHEAVRVALHHFGKRAGTVEPARKVKPRPAKAAVPGKRVSIPRWMKRAVRERDGNRCTYVSPDGRRCEATQGLELDHVDPVADGGETTVAKLRLRCKPHNILHAEARFGRQHMLSCRKRRPAREEATTLAGESD